MNNKIRPSLKKSKLKCLANPNNESIAISQSKVVSFMHSCNHFVLITNDGEKSEFKRVIK